MQAKNTPMFAACFQYPYPEAGMDIAAAMTFLDF